MTDDKLVGRLRDQANRIAHEYGRASNVMWDAADRIEALTAAYADAVAGMRYIRQHHGDLYGVGFDRIEESARALGANHD